MRGSKTQETWRGVGEMRRALWCCIRVLCLGDMVRACERASERARQVVWRVDSCYFLGLVEARDRD